MIVDDEKHLLIMLRKVLLRDGATVDTVSCPVKALNLVSKNSYDLAMIDIEMDSANGLELLDKMRKSVPNLAAVFITGSPPVFLNNRITELGAAGFLEKPIDLSRLREKLVKIFSGSQV